MCSANVWMTQRKSACAWTVLIINMHGCFSTKTISSETSFWLSTVSYLLIFSTTDVQMLLSLIKNNQPGYAKLLVRLGWQRIGEKLVVITAMLDSKNQEFSGTGERQWEIALLFTWSIDFLLSLPQPFSTVFIPKNSLRNHCITGHVKGILGTERQMTVGWTKPSITISYAIYLPEPISSAVFWTVTLNQKYKLTTSNTIILAFSRLHETCITGSVVDGEKIALAGKVMGCRVDIRWWVSHADHQIFTMYIRYFQWNSSCGRWLWPHWLSLHPTERRQNYISNKYSNKYCFHLSMIYIAVSSCR